MTRIKPIVTERLVLRAIDAKDHPRLVELANNWRVVKSLSMMPYPYTPADADAWIGKQDELWVSGHNIPLAITISGSLIGGIGVAVREHGDWELGYWLGEPFWNRGYATEAALALRDFAFEARDLPRLVAGHYADNHASGSILGRLGFRYTRESSRFSLSLGAHVRCLDMVLPRERWADIRHQTRLERAAVA